MKILSDAFGIHENALRARSQRLELLATNIANADTPRFKARDIDFKAVMGQVQKDAIQATNGRHFATAQDGGRADGIRYRVPLNTSADGNTVEMSIEQAQYGKAAADYRASLTFIENRANSIKKALRGE
jgi:flagellar basal-body rod protein FlgB